MEELQATQEEIARKEKSYVARIEELESQHDGNAQEELEALRLHLKEKEREFEKQVQTLSEQSQQSASRSDDWQVAIEVEKALKINLEALQITREELAKKTNG